MMNILVGEDNEFTARQYRMILEKNGHSVVTTKDGSECVKKYRGFVAESHSPDDAFDIVILDHNMPKKTGTRVAKEILAKNPNQKILLVTGYQRWSVEAEAAGLMEKMTLLEKPFTRMQLERKIETLA